MANYEEALRRIEKEKKDKTGSLDLSRLGLEKTPEEIRELVWLKELKLYNNNISDITPLEKLVNLTMLNLGGNKISDITPLEKLVNLTVLNLWSNQISDITPLEKLVNLTELNLSFNQISDITPLEKLVNLTELNLSWNQIEDITPLEKLVNLTMLNLGGNKISDITPLEKLVNLTELNLSWNQIEDITPLEKLVNLTKLRLWSNQISDITPLEKLVNLTELSLRENKISDITPLEKLVNLTALDLDGNQISNITPLGKHVNLKVLNLHSNQIKDITPLEKLVNLTELYLYSNQIKIITPLEKLVNLTGLNLWSNQIKDITPLAQLEKLEYLKITDNPLDIPEEILNASAQEIVSYCKEISNKKEKFSLNELKVLLIGNTNVGKSNLLHIWLQEVGKGNDTIEYISGDSTHGVEYQFLPVEYMNNYVKCHVWDFGGQDYFHATHKLFFSADALHILLWSNDKETREKLSDKKTKDELYDLDYWLRCCEQLSGKSGVIETILVENKIDIGNNDISDFVSHLPRYSIQEKFNIYSPYNNCEDNKCKFIINYCSVSLLKRKRLKGLFELIRERIEYLSGKRIWPYKYIDIRDKLVEKGTEVSSITLEKYYNLTGENDNEKLKTLNRAGSIMYFADAAPGKIFLKPQTLLDILYKQVLTEDLNNNDGRITDEISDAAQKNKLGLTEEEITNLLLSFKLIFKSHDGHFYAPQYLPAVEPAWLKMMKKHNFRSSRIRIESDHYLMNEILLELFSIYGKDIQGSDTSHLFWQNGLVIEDDKEMILIEYERPKLRLKLYDSFSSDNSNLRKSIIDNIVSIIDPKQFVERSYEDNKIGKALGMGKPKIMELLGGALYHAKKAQRGWYSDKINISISNDGEYFVQYRDLVHAAKDECKIITSVNDKGSKKQLSIYDFNEYLPEDLRGKMKKLFISYSHDNMSERKELNKFLVNLKRDGLVQEWNDGLIKPGELWDEVIRHNLEEADIVIMLLSQSFISSSYVHEVEMPIALRKVKKRKGYIFPFLLRTCDWKNWTIIDEDLNEKNKYKVGQYQMQPLKKTEGRLVPLIKWDDKDEAWLQLIDAIRERIAPEKKNQ